MGSIVMAVVSFANDGQQTEFLQLSIAVCLFTVAFPTDFLDYLHV
jgi:hypothetical protein